MGFVTEQIEHDELPVTLMTVEREAGETVEAWRFVSLEFDHFERLTPPELVKDWPLAGAGGKADRQRVQVKRGDEDAF